MSIKSFINSREYLHWTKNILRPISTALWGLSGEEAWLKQLKDQGGKIETIFDVGSSSGWFLSRTYPFFPDANYFHFEPRPNAMTQLKRLAKKLGSRSCFQQIALSDGEAESADFWLMGHADASSLVSTNNWNQSETVGTIKVQLRDLDSVVAEMGVRKIDYLKIDVEGAELRVLKGARRVLREVVEIVMLEISPLRHQGGASETIELFQLMFDSGFSLLDTHSNNYLFSKNPGLSKIYGKVAD